MKKRTNKERTSIRQNTSYPAVPMERKIADMITNKEPIVSDSPTIYTEKKDGVGAAYDIRTDRFEIAQNAMESTTKKSKIAKSENKGETNNVDTASQQSEQENK